MNKRIILILVILIILFGLYFASTKNQITSEQINFPSYNPSLNSFKQKVYEKEPFVYEKRTYNDGVSTAPMEVKGDAYWEKLMNESHAKFGEIVSVYWPDYLVGGVDEFDTDNDGKPEKIVSLLPPGVNGKGSRVDIVKDSKIIFEASEYYASIEPSESHNGFNLIWTSGEQFDKGNVKTKTTFKFENNKFIPVQEVEVPKQLPEFNP